MDKWKVKTGDAEIHDPWEVSLGPIQDYREIPDPWQFEMGPIQDYREYDGSDVEFGPAEIDPLVFGEAEVEQPWSVDIGDAEVMDGPMERTVPWSNDRERSRVDEVAAIVEALHERASASARQRDGKDRMERAVPFKSAPGRR